jgi:signal peptidase I
MRPDVPTNDESIPTPSPLLAQAPRVQVPTRSFLRHLGQGIIIAALAVASYLLVSHFLVESVKVVGLSMSPTLADSQTYLLNRWIFHVRTPKPTDVVVIRDPTDGSLSVKRVVAVAGDSVRVAEGAVSVNGRLLKESYLPPGTPTYPRPGLREQSFKCGADQYFVLGDNRNLSLDSRVYGPISRQRILGLVIR